MQTTLSTVLAKSSGKWLVLRSVGAISQCPLWFLFCGCSLLFSHVLIIRTVLCILAWFLPPYHTWIFLVFSYPFCIMWIWYKGPFLGDKAESKRIYRGAQGGESSRTKRWFQGGPLSLWWPVCAPSWVPPSPPWAQRETHFILGAKGAYCTNLCYDVRTKNLIPLWKIFNFHRFFRERTIFKPWGILPNIRQKSENLFKTFFRNHITLWCKPHPWKLSDFSSEKVCLCLWKLKGPQTLCPLLFFSLLDLTCSLFSRYWICIIFHYIFLTISLEMSYKSI